MYVSTTLVDFCAELCFVPYENLVNPERIPNATILKDSDGQTMGLRFYGAVSFNGTTESFKCIIEAIRIGYWGLAQEPDFIVGWNVLRNMQVSIRGTKRFDSANVGEVMFHDLTPGDSELCLIWRAERSL